MEEEIIKKKDNGYFVGIIGAILGGLIATIPWILMYVYGNMMLSALAIIIALGEFYGYKLFKGKIDNKLPVIIMIIALIIVSFATLIIIPMLLIHNEGLVASTESLKLIYRSSDFKSAIIRDFVISIVFTALGCSVVTANVKKQLRNGITDDMKLDLSNKDAIQKMKKEAIELLKPIFVKYDATSKEKAMMKQEVIAEIENKIQANQYFNYLKNCKIIKKSQGKFYYVEENENLEAKNNKATKVAWIVLAAILAFAVFAIIMSEVEPQVQTIENTDVRYEIGSKWNLMYDFDYEYGWDYARYINTLPAVETIEGTQTNETQIDTSNYPAQININYQQFEEEYAYENIDELKEDIIQYYEEELQISDYNMNIAKSEKGYDELIVISDDEYYECIYYLLNNDKIAYITGVSYEIKDAEELEKSVAEVANSFEWK